MSRKKRRAKGQPRTNPRRPQQMHRASPPYSLADEAHFTSSRRSTGLNPKMKLRYMPISFVSAGFLEGTIKEETCTLVETIASPSSPLDPEVLAQMTLQARPGSPSVSPGPSSTSSEEEVVFRGRGPALVNTAPLTSAVQPPMVTKGQPPVAVPSPTAPLQNAQPSVQLLSTATGIVTPSTKPTFTPRSAGDGTSASAEEESETDSDASGVNDVLFEKRREGRPIWEGRRVEWVSRSKPGVGWLPRGSRPAQGRPRQGKDGYREAAMEDYLQNADAFGLSEEMAFVFSRREMDLDAGSHNDWESNAHRRDVDSVSISSNPEGKGYSSSSGEEDGDEINGDDEEADDEEVDDDKVDDDEVDDDEVDDDEVDDDEVDDDEVDDDEVNDETYAKILQRQEELGLGSDELILYAAEEYFGRGRNATFDFDRPNKKRQHRSGGGYSTSSFPSATAMADALDMDPYSGFDIMDTDRPSLRPVKKGRRGHMPPELEDSDLNDTLQATWRADRNKKRLKKAEREDLRRQGLLGRKGKAPDLSVKYKDGINMMGVMEDIREFLISEMQTLALPPMEAHRRAIVHQVVRSLGVSSKSRGDGNNRFTVLSKTRRSVNLDIIKFDEKINKSGLQRRLRAAHAPGRKEKKHSPVAARPAVGYKDGDVVGASAPELGPENRGHELMKKMGWSKGMALGARDNKGILHPIVHTVKTTKAGLQ